MHLYFVIVAGTAFMGMTEAAALSKAYAETKLAARQELVMESPNGVPYIPADLEGINLLNYLLTDAPHILKRDGVAAPGIGARQAVKQPLLLFHGKTPDAQPREAGEELGKNIDLHTGVHALDLVNRKQARQAMKFEVHEDLGKHPDI